MDKRLMRMCGVLVVASLQVACASKDRLREAELTQLTRWLPGDYDNSEQAKADVRKGVRPPHADVKLVIVPIQSVAMGHNVFYVQEMAADDPRRVMSQRVMSFTSTDKGIVESVASLADPLRWRDAQRDPDVFLGMTPRDLAGGVGCDLLWKMEADRFVGTNDRKHCRASSHAVTGLVEVEYRAELTPEEFSTAEVAYDAGGKLVDGRQDDAFYRFRKTGR
jgi:hypothetical protein